MEWAQLLEAQQRYHDAELQKWREIIKSSVVLLDQVESSRAPQPRGSLSALQRLSPPPQMKDSLLNLQRGIGLRDYGPESEDKSRYH